MSRRKPTVGMGLTDLSGATDPSTIVHPITPPLTAVLPVEASSAWIERIDHANGVR